MEDRHLSSIRICHAEGATPLPPVSRWRSDQGEAAQGQVLRPGVNLGRGVHSKADLHPVSSGALGAAEAQFEAAEFEIHTGVVARTAPEAKCRLVELGGTHRVGGGEGQLTDAAHLPQDASSA